MITFEKITSNNLATAIKIQSELFPKYSAAQNYKESIEENSNYEYFILKLDEQIIGIIGIYHYPQYPDSAWLGWFGIKKNYRRKKYGTQALKMFEEYARIKGFKFARLYTDKFNNDTAISFYISNEYISEDYSNDNDPAHKKYPILIFSKSLTDQPLELWNNKNIHLTEQIEKQ